MQIDHRRFSVRVGICFLPRPDNPLREFLEISIRDEACRIRCGIGKQFVRFTDCLLPLILLQDNEVAAYLRSGMIGKQVVRQSDSRNKVGMFEHLHAGNPFTGVHYALRGDERHDTAIPDRIQTFQEKIIVNGLCGGTTGIITGSRVFGIEHRHVAEWDIGGRHIKIIRERFFNPLESLRTHFMFRVKVREYFSRKQVLVKSHYLRFRSMRLKSGDKHPLSCRRIEQAVGGNAMFMERTGDCRHDFRGSIKRRQHRTFQAIKIAFILFLTGRVLTDKPVQFCRHGEQLPV